MLGGGAHGRELPLAGVLIRRVGSRTVAVANRFALAMLPLLRRRHRRPALTIAPFVFGASGRGTDVGDDAHAIVVEREAARPLMSSFDALFEHRRARRCRTA